VTFTLTSNASGPHGAVAGSSAQFVLTPITSLADIYGSKASGSFTTTLQLF
jgi:hypothetical protein